MLNRPFAQPTIGILGGASDVATGHYYRLINAQANARLGGWDIAETLIAGMNFGNIEHFVRLQQWQPLSDYVDAHVAKLAAARVDLVLCASNTLHRFVPQLVAARGLPFLHIADPTAQAIKAQGLSKAILFGTAPVMRESYMRKRYEQEFGLQIVLPNEAEIVDIDRIIFDELVKNQIRQDSRQRYVDIANRLQRDCGAQALILGCTEIALLLDRPDYLSMPLFDTTALHCAAAVAKVTSLDASAGETS